MAEARSAVAAPFIPKADEGTISTWKDVSKSYRVILIRKYFRIRNSIRNGMWPTSSNHLIVVWGFSMYLLEVRPQRVEPLTNMLLSGIEHLYFSDKIPVRLQHIIFSAGTSFVFFIGLMKLRQYAIRLLLSYRGWMYEIASQRRSIKTYIWGIWMKIFSGYRPSLYSFQKCLPRLPVPPLNDTLAKLLESLEPICTPEEYKKYKKGSENFKKTIGPRLQRILYLKAWWFPNYVSDWWQKYVYLGSRLPLAINSNYYVVDHYAWTPTQHQASRAANILHDVLYMKRQVDRETLTPLVIRNTIPVCMYQYEKIFSTVRVPGVETDTLVHYDSLESRHVVVFFRGDLYFMPVYDVGNQLLSAGTMESIFDEILNTEEVVRTAVEKCIPSLTALPRNEWGRIYLEHFKSGINQKSIEIIEKAICMILLFDKEPIDLSEKGKMLLHGDGTNIWFDKSFNLCFFPSGKCGMNVEHSMADAPVMAHVWEYAMGTEIIEKKYLDKAKVMPSAKSFKQKRFPPIFRLNWDINEDLANEIRKAVITNQKNNADVDLNLYNFKDFGKGKIKKMKISPDSFIQLALQYAYYMDSGRFCQTYEASATRLYRQGRTETIRSCTKESCEFVRAIVEKKLSPKEIFKLLRAAGNKHQLNYRDAMNGKGIDRHIFALYVVSKGLGYSSDFLEDILRRPWTLSTSQQPQTQMPTDDKPDISLEAFREMVGPGGGFGPVADDGYGVSYMLPTEYNIFFHVSSKKSCPKTDSEKFVNHIARCMNDMIEVFEETPYTPWNGL